jgi:nitrogen fixation protein
MQVLVVVKGVVGNSVKVFVKSNNAWGGAMALGQGISLILERI